MSFFFFFNLRERHLVRTQGQEARENALLVEDRMNTPMCDACSEISGCTPLIGNIDVTSENSVER